MLEIEYYYGASRKWFLDFADTLTLATGEEISVKNNTLIFPPSVAEGRFEFYELEEGLGLILTDCIFHIPIRLHRKPVAGNEHYKILFNMSDAPVIVNKESGRTVNISTSFSESVLFTSHTTEISYSPGIDQHMRTVQLIFTRSWALRHLFMHPVPLRVNRLQQLANYQPMQFVTSLNSKSFEVIEEMLSSEIPKHTFKHFLTGCACQLVALFFNSEVELEMDVDRYLSADAIYIIRLKEKIELDLAKTLPTLEEAAKMCLMSRTKFAGMFKTLYNKSYSCFFLELKLEKAANMLLQRYKVRVAAEKVGYNNVGHFIKQFKELYGISPKTYQQKKTNG